MSEPHKVRFWKIEESTGTSGFYITHPGTYSNKESTEKAFPEKGNCRAVEYQQGQGSKGPERV